MKALNATEQLYPIKEKQVIKVMMHCDRQT